MQDEIFETEMKKIPFPEHLFEGNEKLKEFARKNWSGNPEEFIENMSKTLGIKIGEYDPKTGEIPVYRRNK